MGCLMVVRMVRWGDSILGKRTGEVAWPRVGFCRITAIQVRRRIWLEKKSTILAKYILYILFIMFILCPKSSVLVATGGIVSPPGPPAPAPCLKTPF